MPINHLTQIFNELPLIQQCANFLSTNECNELIHYSKNKLIQSEIVDGTTGEIRTDYQCRSATTCIIDDNFSLGEQIFNRIEQFTGINKSHYEYANITHYEVGQRFDLHADYFELTTRNNVKDRLRRGGNRIGTIIIYLNNVDEGGETSFPWLGKLVTPLQGGLIYFKYDYDDGEVNIRTEHESIPVVKGEKYILTVWITEQPKSVEVPEPKLFADEKQIRTNLVDTTFSIECGTTTDKRVLSITLPANNDPRNSIIVPFTGGMDSSLLLFLIGALNNKQSIPYHIIPICVYLDNNGDIHNWENADNVIVMYRLIKELVGGNIKMMMFEPGLSIRDGILKFKDGTNGNYDKVFRTIKKLYVYSAENELPTDDDPRWKNNTWSRTPSYVDFWKQPFFNLQKYHIVDAILQLGLESILEHTQKCAFNHPTLEHNCHQILCNERRWAFTKLNKEEIGNKYFINKGTENEQS